MRERRIESNSKLLGVANGRISQPQIVERVLSAILDMKGLLSYIVNHYAKVENIEVVAQILPPPRTLIGAPKYTSYNRIAPSLCECKKLIIEAENCTDFIKKYLI